MITAEEARQIASKLDTLDGQIRFAAEHGYVSLSVTRITATPEVIAELTALGYTVHTTKETDDVLIVWTNEETPDDWDTITAPETH